MSKLPYDKKLLHEDVKFPLTWGSEDYKMYIFDSENRMVAHVYYKQMSAIHNIHPFEKLIGDYKEFNSQANEDWFLENGEFCDIELGLAVGQVRGWGRLQYLKSPSPEKRQSNIANYILNVINN